MIRFVVGNGPVWIGGQLLVPITTIRMTSPPDKFIDDVGADEGIAEDSKKQQRRIGWQDLFESDLSLLRIKIPRQYKNTNLDGSI